MRVVSAILGVLAVFAMVAFPAQAGGDGVIRAGHYTAEVGEEVTIVLEAVNIPKPGLGAWAVDVTYDSVIVRATGCNSEQGGVCSPAFAEDTVRATGAVVTEGLTGTFPLATYTFACDAVGTSELVVEEVLFTTAEPALEIDDLTLDSGSITCTQPTDLITIRSLELEVGEQGTVLVEAERVTQVGPLLWLAAFTFDSNIISFVACEAFTEAASCGVEQGVFAAGGSGPQPGLLATATFLCNAPGLVQLVSRESGWVLLGPVSPQEIQVEVESGRTTCSAPRLPRAGAANPQPASLPATVPLAVLGAVLVAAALAFRRYALPR